VLRLAQAQADAWKQQADSLWAIVALGAFRWRIPCPFPSFALTASQADPPQGTKPSPAAAPSPDRPGPSGMEQLHAERQQRTQNIDREQRTQNALEEAFMASVARAQGSVPRENYARTVSRSATTARRNRLRCTPCHTPSGYA
jgi:hypothetical protein